MKKFTEFSDELCNQIFDLQIDEPSLIQNNPNIIEDIKQKYLNNIPYPDQIMFNTMYETKKRTKQAMLDVQHGTKNFDQNIKKGFDFIGNIFKQPEQKQPEQKQPEQTNGFLSAEQISRSNKPEPILTKEIEDKATEEFNQIVNEITGEQSQKIELFKNDHDNDDNIYTYSKGNSSSSNRTSGTYAHSAQELARKYSRPGDWHHGVLMISTGTRADRRRNRAREQAKKIAIKGYRVR
jgi:hypothetical protein